MGARVRRLILALCLCLSALAAAPASAATGPRSTDRIEAELVALGAWATPGSTLVVAIRQDIRPGWHTYWRNPGDSGGPTTLSWTLPAGVTAGDIVWPLPERQRLADLMNYGYSGSVYLPVPVAIPASARDGETLTLTVEARFLVCSAEMCVPDDLTLTLDMPVRNGAAPPDPRHGPAIAAALKAVPQPAGIQARAALSDGRLTLTATGGPAAEGPRTDVFFLPYRAGVIDHAAAQTGSRGPEGLRLDLTPGRRLAAGQEARLDGVLVIDGRGYEISATPGPALDGVAGEGEIREASRAGAGGGGFLRAALLALLGGLILNLMPCVLPILAMKAAALASVAHDPAAARRDGLGFLTGVLATFLGLAAVMIALRAGGQAIGWGFQLQSPAVVAGLALLMLAVALNLSGAFHMGAGLQAAGSGPLSRLPGAAGAVLTGALAVIVAAPCTAPFMAVALGAALVMPWPMALAVFLMLGIGFALPFVAISLSPALIRRLPRPGPWMDRFKTLLALPMYGAALWLAWVFSRQAGVTATALLLAGGLALGLGLWLTGRLQAADAPAARRRPVMAAAATALVVALSLAVGARLVARPPATDEPAPGRLSAAAWSPEAVEAARAAGRPVFVNFTADWCVTCKINERTALGSKRVEDAFRAANAVYLVGDWTSRDPAIAAELARHGRSGVPLYLVYSPEAAEPVVLPQLLGEGGVIAAVEAAGRR